MSPVIGVGPICSQNFSMSTNFRYDIDTVDKRYRLVILSVSLSIPTLASATRPSGGCRPSLLTNSLGGSCVTTTRLHLCSGLNSQSIMTVYRAGPYNLIQLEASSEFGTPSERYCWGLDSQVTSKNLDPVLDARASRACPATMK